MRCLAKSHTSPRGGSSERGRGGLISPAAGSSSFPERRPQCNHYNYHYNSTTTSTTAGSAPDDRGDHPGVQEAVWQTKARDSDAESDDDASGGEEERGEEEEEECDEQ